MNKKLPTRKSIRLEGYDYSQAGVYFVTIVTKDREALFGEILNGEMKLNELGVIVKEEWIRSASIRAEIELDEFVVMPNHFHAIVHIFNDQNGSGDRPVAATRSKPGPKPKSISGLVGRFKSAVTLRINLLRNTPARPVWQDNFYDHIIGNDKEYDDVAEYIFNNPENWERDREINL